MKIGINPLPWVMDSDFNFHLDTPTLSTAFEELKAAGFTAVQADVPEGMDAAAYGAFLDKFGLRPAPGYFGGFFDKSDDLAKTIEAAKQHAAKQAQLGLTEVMIAQHLSPQRIARPAVGADFDADRLSLVIENLVTVAQIIRAEGIQPCLHPHVGSWIETESEIRTVLDAVDPAALSFGPDPGHLFWANADPVSLITDYRDRVRAAHLKDVHAAAREKSRFEVSDYRQATGKNHVWTELGRGDVDLVGVLKALPDAFGGWLVVEVDVPDLGTPAESTHASARWIRTQPVLQGGLV